MGALLVESRSHGRSIFGALGRFGGSELSADQIEGPFQGEIQEARSVKGTSFTVTEAQLILRAEEAFVLTGITFSTAECEVWTALVASANERVALWNGAEHKELPSWAVGNDPSAQTPCPETEVRLLREGIETIVSAFGTNSAEWTQQLRGLLERVLCAWAARTCALRGKGGSTC